MPVVTLLNQKGGVGKTSCTHHLAGTLARAGRKILVVDNDPQSSLTQGFWGPEGMRAVDPGDSVAALYDPRRVAIPERIIRPTGLPNLSIVPGSEALTEFNITPTSEWGRSERGMAEFLDEVRGDFDLILIDCPPNLHLCSWAALVASDHLVVPLQAEDYGAQGLGPVQRSYMAVRAAANPRLGLLGYLITMFDKRLAIHLAYEATLRKMYGTEVFDATFPMAKDFKEAVASRLPISHYKPKSAPAKATQAVADEILARVGRAAGPVVERSVA